MQETVNLTNEEFKALNIKTTRDPKQYIQASVANICNKLGLPGKTVAVVYYRAFLEQEQNAGDKSSKPLLTEAELRFLKLAGQDHRPLALIGRRIFGNEDSGYRCRNRIRDKLRVSSLQEAVDKAVEMGILPKKN